MLVATPKETAPVPPAVRPGISRQAIARRPAEGFLSVRAPRAPGFDRRTIGCRAERSSDLCGTEGSASFATMEDKSGSSTEAR